MSAAPIVLGAGPAPGAEDSLAIVDAGDPAICTAPPTDDELYAYARTGVAFTRLAALSKLVLGSGMAWLATYGGWLLALALALLGLVEAATTGGLAAAVVGAVAAVTAVGLLAWASRRGEA